MVLELLMKFKIELLEYSDYASLVDYDSVKAFRDRALSPNKPVIGGAAQNQIYIFKKERPQIDIMIILFL